LSVEWIEYKGKRILLIDLRGLAPEAIIENLDLTDQMLLEIPLGTRVSHLTDFEGAVVNTEVMARLKASGKEVVEPRTEKAAVVGVHGIRHILLAAYNRVTGAGKNQKLFDTQEEALEWLVS
jgi:hypothetical protein